MSKQYNDAHADREVIRRCAPESPVAAQALSATTPLAARALQRAQTDARTLSPAGVLALQRAVGNRASSALLQQHRGAAAAVQRSATSPVSPAQPDIGARIRSAAGRGSPLPSAVRDHLGAGLNADLSGVRVHTDGEADSLSQSVQAVAFTSGADIFFRAGAYNPSTPQGLHLLAHEAAHTVQQAAGPVAGTPRPGGVSISDPSDSFERAAEASAAQVSAAADLALQRHADDGGAHRCTPGCHHTIQRTAQPHVCGPNCHHAAPRPLLMRRVAQPPLRPRTALQRTTRATGVPVVVQRHSSFEHKMLGDVSPDALQVLASAKNINQAGRAVDSNGAAIMGPNNQVITRQNVLHVLEQEIRRINYFKAKAVYPQGHAQAGQSMSRQDFQAHLRAKEAQFDPTWQVRIVELPSIGGAAPLLVTYGEMNTLADLYGSPREVLDADPWNRYQLVQGIRQQSLLKFLDMQREVNNTNWFTRTFGTHIGEGFDDAIGNTGRGGSMMGELSLMGTGLATGKKTGTADASQSYKAGLARNACHFAPESWHAWADYHKKARQFAMQAYNLRHPAGGAAPTPVEVAQANQAENDALINNGFGDHFLQDSYAAGHLINKTQVMQWFVKWLDEHPWESDKESDAEWRKIQSIGYNQRGIGLESRRYRTGRVGKTRAKDAQSAENIDDPGGLGGAMQGKHTRFAALGLRLPPSLTPNDPAFNFLVAWQESAATNRAAQQMTVQQATTGNPLAPNEQGAVDAFKRLVKDDVAYVSGTGIVAYVSGTGITRQNVVNKTNDEIKAMTFMLRPEYIPSDATAFANLRAQIGAGAANAQQEYADKAMISTYAQYHKFLNSTLLQAGTNVLHDHFCTNGIEVISDSGFALGRIYGDDAMLGKDSARGVKYSGETAQMSRQAIFDLIDYGPNDPAHPIPPITSISTRFPTQAKLDNGGYGRLDRWHQDLERLCNTKIFPDTKGGIKNLAATVSSGLSDKVSKDAHQGALF